MEEVEELPPLNPSSEVSPTLETTSDEFVPYPVALYDVTPYRMYHFFQHFSNSTIPNNFLKGVKWSPDGSCFLTCADDNSICSFNLPYDDSGNPVNVPSSVPEEDSFTAYNVITEGESVYDYCWYPHMSSSNPDLCVFAATTRDHPIHLWDSNSGQLRCTYRAYDAMDEITSAFSISFNPAGSKIFAGYNKSIRTFDVHRPGREFTQHSTVLGNKEGQLGIISSIAFSPSDSGILAAGSYSQTAAMYREDNMELLYVLHGQEGGVTQVQFSKDGNYLYTGGRKDPYILCWDIRNTVDIVFKLFRSTESTNQKIHFDIEPNGRYLGTGGQDGLVHFYDLQTGQWVSSFQAALDTVNGFAFHPFGQLAATSSGQRRFEGLDMDDSQDYSSPNVNENCVSIWNFYCST